MGMSAFYGPTKTEEENFKVLSRAADMGVTFWDTADVYGNGHNEGTSHSLSTPHTLFCCIGSFEFVGYCCSGLGMELLDEIYSSNFISRNDREMVQENGSSK